MQKDGTHWAEFVRAYLRRGTDYGYSIYRSFAKLQDKEGYTPLKYLSFMKYLYILRKLNLIKRGKTEPADNTGYERQYYEIVSAKIHDPAWNNPKKALYGG